MCSSDLINPEFKDRFLTLRDAEAVIVESYKVSSARRPDLIVDWAYTLDDSDGPLFWEVVKEVWSSFDLVLHDDFHELFSQFCRSLPKVNLPKGLPKKFTAYRGQKDGGEANGLSWTLNRDVAVKFSKGTRGETAPNPIVFEKEVWASDVAFYCNDRNEEEVVLFETPY